MSFSQDIKEECSRQMPPARHCQLAELAAIISGCGSISIRRHRRLFLILLSENQYLIRKAEKLIRAAFQTVPECSVLMSGGQKNPSYMLAVTEPEQAARILKAVKYLIFMKVMDQNARDTFFRTIRSSLRKARSS